MRRLTMIVALVLAATAVIATTAGASTTYTITPSGANTVSFPANGITFSITSPVPTTLACPISFSVNLLGTSVQLANGDLSVGTVTAVNPNPLNCTSSSGIPVTLTFSGLPWLIAGTGTGTNHAVIVRGVRVNATALGGALNCNFTGSVTVPLPGTNPVSRTGRPSGTLAATGGCSSATIGGNGGTLGRAVSITP